MLEPGFRCNSHLICFSALLTCCQSAISTVVKHERTQDTYEDSDWTPQRVYLVRPQFKNFHDPSFEVYHNSIN